MAFKGDVKLNSKIDSALRKIAAAGGEYSQVDLAKKLGVNSDRIYNRQQKLKAEGLIFKTSLGRPQYSKKVIDAIDNIVKELDVFKKIKLIPSNFAEQMSKKYDIPSYTVTSGLRNLKDINLKDITAAKPEVVAAYEEYIKLPKNIKQVYGTKAKILEKYIKNPSRFEKRYFGEVLSKTKETVKEIRPVGNNFSAYNNIIRGSQKGIEDALTGTKEGIVSKYIDLKGKYGSDVAKAHLTSKTGEFGRVGNIGFLSKGLNTALGYKSSGVGELTGFGAINPEKFRDTLEQHIQKINKNYKGKTLYNISNNRSSIDQTRFKNTLEKVFGKTTGKVPLKDYLDKVVNEEARLIGQSTDGLITSRTIDPKTLKISEIGFGSTRGIASNDPTFASKSFKDIYSKFKKGDLKDMNKLKEVANSEFQRSLLDIKKNNITPLNMNKIVNRINNFLSQGVVNQDFTEISKLASQCRSLRASGGRVNFANGSSACALTKQAIQKLPNESFLKTATDINKIKGLLKTFGSFLGKGKAFAVTAGVGAGAGALVKAFRNDDPDTYLSNENQMKAMLVDTFEEDTLGKAGIGGELAAAGLSVPGSAAVYKARRLPFKNRAAMGPVRAALGPVGKAASGFATPLGMALTTPLQIASQLREGDSLEDIATNPLNYLGPAFAGTLTKEATRGMNPQGLLARGLRLGMSPAGVRGVSKFFGLPGLALSLGYEGYDQYKKYQEGEGFLYNLLNKDE